MAWLQLKVLSQHPEFVEEILLAHEAQAVSMLDAADEPLLEPKPGETPLWQQTVTLGLFTTDRSLGEVEKALRELLPDGATAHYSSELIEDRDWVRVWLDSWQPLKFGQRLWVTPREKAGQIHDAGAVILRLDPGLAFGTGTHQSTALCLEWLDAQDLRGKTVLDYGCGSGILAIAALLLGAERAVCVDIDPQALLAARENAAANGLEGKLTALTPEAFVPFPADVVLANILANPLIQLAPLLASSIKTGGRLALAGLTEVQADEVRAAYAPWFDFEADGHKEGWSRINARCRRPALINFLQLSPRIGSAGQPQREHFAQLAAEGYRRVINLALPTSPNALTDEAALCAQHALHYTHIPVPWEQPTAQHYAQFVAAMTAAGEDKVLVHCALNKRVSAFLYLYRILSLGTAAESARHDLEKIWQPEAPWARLIEEMLMQKSA